MAFFTPRDHLLSFRVAGGYYGIFLEFIMKAEEEFPDVLQNIEFGIISVYRRNRALLDRDVHDAIEAAIREYTAEERGQGPPVMRLSQQAQAVCRAVKGMCEWRLGRGAPAFLEDAPPAGEMTPLTVSDILLCLRRIDRSIRRWSGMAGRQGYLNYADQFIL